MKQTQSPAQKRLENLQLFYNYCCETYKNKLEGNDELLKQIYNIIQIRLLYTMQLNIFINKPRNNGFYLQVIQDFIDLKTLYNCWQISCKIRRRSLYNWLKISWQIRQTSMAIIKLINEKL